MGSATVVENGANRSHPIIYVNGQRREIPAVGGGSRPCLAFAVNNRGQVVVGSGFADAEHAFLYENGATRDLGTLGGSRSEASNINESGQIVGFATTGSGSQHGFLYQNNAMTDLSTYSPYPSGSSDARAINDKGQIVLQCSPPEGGNGRTVYLLLTPSSKKR